MASPYGQPQSGYGQPSYAPLDGGYPAPYAPYNGPASAYQPGAPPQGKVQLLPTCSRTSVCMIEREGHQATCDALQAFTELFP